MKKSLLALAVLGAFAGVASAQSSVTIYGSLDQGIAKSNGGTAGNNGGAAGNGAQAKAYTLQQANASRLGFRGNEDLGGGLSAQFQIEHRFNPDTGTAQNANIFWQGRSYVQLSSATAGRVYLGRDYTPAFWPAVKSDPFGWDGVGQGGLNMFAGFRSPNAGSLSGNNVRTSNTVGYKSPTFGGLTVQAAVAMGENVVGRDGGINVEYGAGPIYAALGYEKVSNRGTASAIGTAAATAAQDQNSRNGDSLFNAAIHYDFGVVKPIFYYARSKNAATGGTNKFWQIAALAPLGGGTVKAAYWKSDLAASNTATAAVAAANPTGNNTDSRKFGLGYDYPLSKRTNVYADLGLTRADFKTNNSTYSFGVKHTF